LVRTIYKKEETMVFSFFLFALRNGMPWFCFKVANFNKGSLALFLSNRIVRYKRRLKAKRCGAGWQMNL